MDGLALASTFCFIDSRSCAMPLSKGILAVAFLMTFSAVCSAEQTATSAYRQAADYYQAAQWDEAVAALRHYIAQFPNHPRALDALFYLGEAQLQLGQVAGAANSYQRFIDGLGQKSHDDKPTALYRLGETAFLRGQTELADRTLRSFCEQYPQHALVAYSLPYLADIALQSGEYEAALSAGQAQLQRTDAAHRFEAEFVCARALEALGRWDEMRAACDRIQRDPVASSSVLVDKARLMSARSLMRQQRYDQALRALRRLSCTVESPDIAVMALLDAGSCYESLRDRRGAVQAYTSILVQLPKSPAALEAAQRLQAIGGMS